MVFSVFFVLSFLTALWAFKKIIVGGETDFPEFRPQIPRRGEKKEGGKKSYEEKNELMKYPGKR